MGYEIHITRASSWLESDQNPITTQEWLSLVETDPELMIDKRDNGPFFALWLSKSLEGDHPWFDWSEGAINTKNPDRIILAKALEIAKQLKAQVQGDEGEVYDRPEDLEE